MDPFDYLLDVDNNRLLSSLLDFENTPPLKSGSQESKHCSVTDDDSEPPFYQGQNLVDTTLLDTSALKESILKPSTRENWQSKGASKAGQPQRPKVTFKTPVKSPRKRKPAAAAEGKEAAVCGSGDGVCYKQNLSAIRWLDEQEQWAERTSVVTRHEHQEYELIARQIVDDLIDTSTVVKPAAEIIAQDSRDDCVKPLRENAPVTDPVTPAAAPPTAATLPVNVVSNGDVDITVEEVAKVKEAAKVEEDQKARPADVGAFNVEDLIPSFETLSLYKGVAEEDAVNTHAEPVIEPAVVEAHKVVEPDTNQLVCPTGNSEGFAAGQNTVIQEQVQPVPPGDISEELKGDLSCGRSELTDQATPSFNASETEVKLVTVVPETNETVPSFSEQDTCATAERHVEPDCIAEVEKLTTSTGDILTGEQGESISGCIDRVASEQSSVSTARCVEEPCLISQCPEEFPAPVEDPAVCAEELGLPVEKPSVSLEELPLPIKTAAPSLEELPLPIKTAAPSLEELPLPIKTAAPSLEELHLPVQNSEHPTTGEKSPEKDQADRPEPHTGTPTQLNSAAVKPTASPVVEQRDTQVAFDDIPIPTVLRTMAEESEDRPLPRGAYKINWDEIDENSDPFGGKLPADAKLGVVTEATPLPPPMLEKEDAQPNPEVGIAVEKPPVRSAPKPAKKPVMKGKPTAKDATAKPKVARPSMREQIKAARAKKQQNSDDVEIVMPTNNNDVEIVMPTNNNDVEIVMPTNKNDVEVVMPTNNNNKVTESLEILASTDSDKEARVLNDVAAAPPGGLQRPYSMSDSGIGGSPSAHKHNTQQAPSLAQNGETRREASGDTLREASGETTPDTDAGSETPTDIAPESESDARVAVETSAASPPSPGSGKLRVGDAAHGGSSEDEWYDAGPTPIAPAMLPSINGMTESAMTVTNEFPADGSGSQEEFRPATEFFNDPNAFEYLEGRGAHMKPSALARQSLYQMFDPMLGTPSPPAQRTAAAAPTIIKEQPESSNPNDETFALMGTPPLSARPAPMSTETPPGLSRCILDQTNMLDASINPAGGLPQQLNTLVLIPQAQNGPNEIVQILQYSEQDAENMISRNNLEWTNKMFVQRGEWEKKTKVLEREMHELHNTHQRKLQENVDMKGVVSEYETTISQLIAEKEHNKCEATENNSELVAERDQVLEDMQNVEKAFSDLHRRYEKAKGVVEALRKNEDTLKCMVEEYQAKLKKQEHRYQELKNKAEEKLESAVMEIETIKRNNASELVALRAGLKRADMKVANLDRICEQKTKENQELTNICDELIAKVTR